VSARSIVVIVVVVVDAGWLISEEGNDVARGKLRFGRSVGSVSYWVLQMWVLPKRCSSE